MCFLHNVHKFFERTFSDIFDTSEVLQKLSGFLLGLFLTLFSEAKLFYFFLRYKRRGQGAENKLAYSIEKSGQCPYI